MAEPKLGNILSQVTVGNLFSIISTIVVGAVTVGAVWGLFGYRVAQLELAVTAIRADEANFARATDIADTKAQALDLRNAISANTKQAADLNATVVGVTATIQALKDSVVDLKNRLDRQEDKNP